jgi:cytochrome c5
MAKKPCAIAVFKWHKRSVQGRDTLEDDEHTGRPRTIRTELKSQEVAMLVHANCYQTVDKIAAAAGISNGICHKILSDDLNMCHVTQHSVPLLSKRNC